MGNNKGNRAPAQIAGRLTITVFADRNRPPALETTADLAGTLQIFGAGLLALAIAVEQMDKTEAERPVVDKKRQYLGPRGEPSESAENKG